MSFVVSTDEVDRHGDVVSVNGWRLQSYGRNPVFLWAHDYTQPAIGRAVDMWLEDHGLLATMEFAPTDFAREVAALYQGGYQRGVSVGFRPLKYELRRDAQSGEVLGINFTGRSCWRSARLPFRPTRAPFARPWTGRPGCAGTTPARAWEGRVPQPMPSSYPGNELLRRFWKPYSNCVGSQAE